jgi:hypothetical protein
MRILAPDKERDLQMDPLETPVLIIRRCHTYGLAANVFPCYHVFSGYHLVPQF